MNYSARTNYKRKYIKLKVLNGLDVDEFNVFSTRAGRSNLKCCLKKFQNSFNNKLNFAVFQFRINRNRYLEII